MSLKPKEFIKKIRACKTLDEERSLINKESAEIRNLSKEHSEKYALRSLAKCIAMSLLGYPTEFIHMTCLGLLANPKFTQKRLAYLGICVLLDEKSEVLLLTSHTIKKDLESTNQFIVASALNAIGEIATADMCRDTCPEVLKCLSSSNPYIKKKASLALVKIIKTCPELIDTVAQKLKLVFEDKNHGVLIGGLSLAVQIFKTDETYIRKYKKYVPYMLKYFKNLSTTNYSPEYDINGITDPFLQAKILEVLAYFGRIYEDENEELSNLLGTIPTNTDTGTKNTGNAVLYELVRTIFAFDSSSGLKTLASSILGKFLTNKDNNYKYIAMNELQDIARIDLPSVQKHKNVILEFLSDNDIAIKRKSLDLTYTIVNESNIKQIIKESLNFLNTGANNEFKEELTRKIFESLEKYSPSLKWEIDILIKMLCLAENHVSDEIICKIINLIINIKDLHQYSMFKIFVAMQSNGLSQECLMKVGIYLLGELCHLILNVSVQVDTNETVTITENDVVSLISELIYSKDTSEVLHEALTNCCFKLLGQLSPDACEKIKELLNKETKSFYCEVQERANEYLVFTQIANDEMQRSITERIPLNKDNVNEENQLKKNIVVEEFEGEEENAGNYGSLIKNKGVPSNKGEGGKGGEKNVGSGFDVFGNEGSGQQQEQKQQKMGGLLDDIGDLFNTGATQTGNVVSSTQGNVGNVNANANANVFDIFDMTNMMNSQQNQNPIQTQQQQPPMQNQQQQSMDIFAQLGNLYNNPQPQAQPQQTSLPFNNMMPTMQMQPQQQQPIQQQPLQNPSMKENYKNSDISIYSSFTFNPSDSIFSGAFYISNNTSKRITNVKVNFLVRKHVTFKVLSTSGSVLEPNSSLGIKKEVTMLNNDATKPIAIKTNISYSIEGKDISESAMITNVI